MARREEGSGAGNQGLDAVVGRGENDAQKRAVLGGTEEQGKSTEEADMYPLLFQ